jgi:hypothetical protein
MTSAFEALDSAMSAVMSSAFAEPARLQPRVASQYAERAADPDRPEATVHGIFSAGPAQDDLSGQARGGKLSGTTQLASTAAEFWIAKAQVDALPWVPVTGDALVLTARSDAPVHAVTRIATTDLGDLTLTLVREDQPT